VDPSHFNPHANSRLAKIISQIVLSLNHWSDSDFNIGESSDAAMGRLIKKKEKEASKKISCRRK
jgi:hypothetical protein